MQTRLYLNFAYVLIDTQHVKVDGLAPLGLVKDVIGPDKETARRDEGLITISAERPEDSGQTHIL